MTNSSIADIGKIETFPMKKKKIGNWEVRDISFSKLKKEGQRNIFYKSQLCMSAVFDHWLAMEFDFYGDVYKSAPDSINTILDSFGVDITVDANNIRYGSKWENIARSRDLIILRRIP